MSRYAQLAGGVVVAFLPGPPQQWADLHAAGALVPAGDEVRLGWVWDGAQLVTPPTPAVSPVSALEFRRRFTPSERAAITLAAKQALDEGDATLQVWLDDLNSAVEVHLDHPDILAGLDYLVAAGKLTPERRDEVLT